jgi:solute:Na+ symporter, SSS family
MALAERRVSVDSSWLHNPTLGKYFPFVLGIGAIFRRRIQSSEDYFPSGRSLHSRVTRLANLGAIANLGPSYEYKVESDLPNTISWASCGEVI